MIKSGSYFLFFLLSYFSVVSSVWAAKINTELSENRVAIGDVFSIIVTVETSGKNKPQVEVSSKDRPKNEAISYLRESQGMSFNTSIINGQISASSTVQLSLTYYAKKEGVVRIPPIVVTVDGKKQKAPGAEIVIVKSGEAKKNQGGSPFQSMESLFSKYLNKHFNMGGGGSNSDELDFFIDVEVSNMTPYYGEQFIVQWYLYSNGRITDIDTLKYPALEGFWKEEISLAVSLRGEDVVKDGKNYVRYLLASYAVAPLVKDKATIDSYEVKCNLMGMGQLFTAQSKEFIRKSDEAMLQVKPLPLPKPQNFTGAVGDYSIVDYVEGQNIRVGEPFVYRIRVSGLGQVKFMELPKLDFGPNFEIYNINEESYFHIPDRSEKIYSILIVPKSTEVKTIPSLAFSFFNPSTAKYYELSTKGQDIEVLEGSGEDSQIIANIDSDATGSGKKFVPEFYSQVKAAKGKVKLWSFTWYWAGYLVLVLLSFGFIFYKYISSKVVYSFEKDLQQRFSVLFALVDEGKWREASTQAVNIVYFYANAQSRRFSRSQKLSDILAVLPSSLRRKIELALEDLNNDLQKYSFAPESLIVKASNTTVKCPSTLRLKCNRQ